MAEKTYEDGVAEGRLASVENMLGEHKGRLDNHANRLRLLERVVWAVFGIGVLLNFLPKIQAFLSG